MRLILRVDPEDRPPNKTNPNLCDVQHTEES